MSDHEEARGPREDGDRPGETEGGVGTQAEPRDERVPDMPARRAGMTDAAVLDAIREAVLHEAPGRRRRSEPAGEEVHAPVVEGTESIAPNGDDDGDRLNEPVSLPAPDEAVAADRSIDLSEPDLAEPDAPELNVPEPDAPMRDVEDTAGEVCDEDAPDADPSEDPPADAAAPDGAPLEAPIGDGDAHSDLTVDEAALAEDDVSDPEPDPDHGQGTEDIVEADTDDVAGPLADAPEPVVPGGGIDMVRIVEAVLFASGEPLSEKVLADRLPSDVDVRAILAELAALYDGRGVTLVSVAGKWAFRTAPDLGFLLQKERVEPKKLSRAAIETLAIIAYHQPVTRAEIEELRGVSVSKGTLDVLLDVGWVRMRGRKPVPGRPITYGTSDDFLEHFGLATVTDLPGLEELKAAGLLDWRLPPNFNIPSPKKDGQGDGDGDVDADAAEEEELRAALDDVEIDDAEAKDPDAEDSVSQEAIALDGAAEDPEAEAVSDDATQADVLTDDPVSEDLASEEVIPDVSGLDNTAGDAPEADDEPSAAPDAPDGAVFEEDDDETLIG